MPSYVRSLFSLWRSRRDNPVVRATAPWRSTSRGRLWFWTLLGISIVGSLLAGGWMRAATDGRAGDLAYVAAFVAIPLWVVAALSLFGFRHREDDSLESLFLTRLTPEEVAFGAVHGGVVAGALFAAATLAGYALAVVGSADFHPHRAGVLVALWAASTGAGVRAWILSFGRKGHLVLYTGAFAVALFLLAGIVEVVIPERRWVGAVGTGVLAVSLLRQAGRFAGLRFFAPVDWENLCRAYWLTNELVGLFEVEARKEALRTVRSKNRLAPFDLLAGWAAGGAVLAVFALWMRRLAAAGARATGWAAESMDWSLTLGDPVVALLAGQVAVLVALTVRVRGQAGALWAPAGAIHVGMLSHVGLAAVPFAGAMLTAASAAWLGEGLDAERVGGATWAGAVAASAVLAGFVWMMAAATGRPGATLAVFGAGWGIAALGLLWHLAAQAAGGVWDGSGGAMANGVGFGYGRRFAGLVLLAPAPERADGTLLIRLAVYASLGCLLFWGRLCQTIHERYLGNVSRHTAVRIGAGKRRGQD